MCYSQSGNTIWQLLSNTCAGERGAVLVVCGLSSGPQSVVRQSAARWRQDNFPFTSTSTSPAPHNNIIGRWCCIVGTPVLVCASVTCDSSGTQYLGPGYCVPGDCDCDCVGDRAVTGAGLAAMVGTKYFLW